jgi:hypothetical protein
MVLALEVEASAGPPRRAGCDPALGLEMTVPGAISAPSSHALGYGVEYTWGQINDTLTSASPATTVSHVDEA